MAEAKKKQKTSPESPWHGYFIGKKPWKGCRIWKMKLHTVRGPLPANDQQQQQQEQQKQQKQTATTTINLNGSSVNN